MLSGARGIGTFCAIDLKDAATLNRYSTMLRDAGMFLNPSRAICSY